jgi:hypothetical protein
MEIWAEFDGKSWRFHPDPAIVDQGTPITWRFQNTTLLIPRIRWTAYFDHGAPFRTQGDRFSTITSLFFGQHAGSTGTVTADDPGDYKYGVRAEDALSQAVLGDDDPRLIVRP